SAPPPPPPGDTVHAEPHHAGGPQTVSVLAIDSLGAELARTGPTLVLASLGAGVVKGFVPGSFFAALGAQPILAAIVMMTLAFLLSICSSADAFVAASLPLAAL